MSIKKTVPRLEYVGGFEIYAKAPKKLAQWYTNKFGLKLEIEYQGGYYGGIKRSWGTLHFGIKRQDKNTNYKSNFAIVFRVNDFDGYLKMVKSRGIKPIQTSDDDEGRFATFKDPESNLVSVWGK